MKKCPYCAEMIQDEAIKCRYCFSDLRASADEAIAMSPGPSTPGDDPTATGSGAEASASAGSEAPRDSAEGSPATKPDDVGAGAPMGTSPGAAVKYTHSGYSYVLGYGADFFGIWSRQNPAAPAHRFPRTDDGWKEAWTRFVGLEPNHVAVPDGGGTVPGAAPASSSTAPMDSDDEVLQYTHSGTRYLLGYGKSFFGIWDRQSPTHPVERFPRTDDGWAQAWRRYTQIENHYAEVSLGGSSGAAGPAAPSGS